MLLVRREQPADIAAIRQVHALVFGRSAEANLVDTLRMRGKVVLSLVAAEGDRIVGHILFSPVTIESDDHTFPAVGLAPMAVLPEFQRRGIGSLLVKASLVECQHLGYDGVVVLGHPSYYPRFGFVPASRYGIRSEHEAPDEALMIVALREGALRDWGGLARYPSEFHEV